MHQIVVSRLYGKISEACEQKSVQKDVPWVMGETSGAEAPFTQAFRDASLLTSTPHCSL